MKYARTTQLARIRLHLSPPTEKEKAPLPVGSQIDTSDWSDDPELWGDK